MDGMNGLELGGIVAIAFGLIEIIKALINKRFGNNKNGVGLTDEQKHQLQTLHDLHYRFDGDGAPLWYVPRSWGETQKEIAKLIASVAQTQDQQTQILQKIIERLED